jgi:hypothetical protein
MGKAVLVDAQSVVFAAGGRLMSVAITDLDRAFEEKTDVAVVPTDVVRLVSTSEDGLHRQVLEKLPPNSVYCWEHLQGAAYQVFTMPAAILQTLRASKWVRSVVPYAVVAREGNKSTIVASTMSQKIEPSGVITRAGRAFFGGEQAAAAGDESGANDVTIIDYVVDRPILIVLRGAEVKTIRSLHPEDSVERELTLTLQGLSMPNCPVVTPNRALADKLREVGRSAQVVRLPPDVPTIGIHGMRRTVTVQFHLADERARIRRRELRLQQMRSVVLAGVFCAGAVAAATVVTGTRIQSEHELKELQQRVFATNETRTRLFRERYAAMISGRTVDLPQAWAELEMMIPPQLQVERVTMKAGYLGASLARRDLPVDQRDPPISLQEIRQAMARSATWRSAKVEIRLTARSDHLTYILEKRREPASP